MQKYKLCIVGLGAAGLLTLFALSFTKIPPEEILCIDPHHDGGNLQRKWASIRSNTIWNQMLEILRSKQIDPQTLPQQWQQLDPSKPTELSNYIQLLMHVTKSYRLQCTLVHSSVTSITNEGNDITVHLKNTASYCTKSLILATGSEPKDLEYPIPSIPLEVAFSLDRLRTYVKPQEKVIVFGTAHSGTLLLSNLHQLQVKTYAFHKGEKPFLFARDGEYDGIKQDAERIADDIIAGKYPNLTYHSLNNTAELISKVRKADWVIYATGFERTQLTSSYTYNGNTGRIDQLPNTWGFGIGFPNRAEDGIHWDVSIPSFFGHIEKQIPWIVESFYA